MAAGRVVAPARSGGRPWLEALLVRQRLQAAATGPSASQRRQRGGLARAWLTALAECWAGSSPFAGSALELDLEEAALVRLVRQRAPLPAEAGFPLLLPSGLRQPRRGRVPASICRGCSASNGRRCWGRRPSPPPTWTPCGGPPGSNAPLVRLRGQWTLVDAAAVAGLLQLAGDLHRRAEALPTPAGFAGTLRPYQQRGLGWLVFLGRLGLGACLADPLAAPTVVVAPVSLLGN